ncbi:phospholipase D family protein [Variovorax paradoxus]|nr:phospholipase D family protein [Variovorax paradoxus]
MLEGWLCRWLLVLAALLAGGCGGLPPHPTAQASHALAPSSATQLGAAASKAAARTGQSGFRALPEAAFALDARVELMRRAQASIDVQYYLVGQDEVGRTLMRSLRDAASRGVRVRLLVDDAYTLGMDALLLGLASHPNVEVRLFNPFGIGRDSAVGRALNAMGDFRRLNHRMHNKLLVVDGAMAIVGGRNMADEYFQRHANANFLDFDVLAIGPVVDELAQSFDTYWNSPQVVPVQAVAASTLSTERLRSDFERDVRAQADRAPLPLPLPDVDVHGHPPLGADIDRGLPQLIWAPARAYADRPDKIGLEQRPAQFATTVTYDTIKSLREAKSEIVLVSAYFIPGNDGMAQLVEARRHGVAVRVITNSMASTDEPLVGMAYERYRMPLLKAGVELFELSSPQLKADQRLRNTFGASKGSLHAKLAFVDRRILLVGSMNLDPRSAWINTELGVRIDSAELVRQIGGLPAIESGTGAYRVQLGPNGADLLWMPVARGASAQALTEEPDISAVKRLKLRFLSLFVAESLL